eukprot:GILK01008528.1.p1 GENE.GILK01008528.1~~GILK01008528.1.p1  ORF type:complete len:266 (-),score=25.81 GILK01008528.1:131-844(-)
MAASYPILRMLTDSSKLQENWPARFPKEDQILLTLGVMCLTRIYKAATPEEFLSSLFTFFKIAYVCLFFCIHVRYAILFSILLIVIWVCFQPPEYKGPSKVTEIRSSTQYQECLNESTHVIWLMEVYSRTNQECLNFAPLWAQLSLNYGSTNLRFGRIHAETCVSVARQLNVDVSGVSLDLPTIILFKKGEEVGRLPTETQKQSWRRTKLTKAVVEKYFSLGQLSEEAEKVAAKKQK